MKRELICLTCCLLLAIAVLCAAAIGRIEEKKYKQRKGIVSGVFAALMGAGSLMGMYRLHENMRLYCVFSILLLIALYISYEDIMTRIVSNVYLWLIPLGLIASDSWQDRTVRIAAMLVIGSIGIVLALISNGEGIGGADVKFMITSASLLGHTIWYAIFISSFLSVTIGSCVRKIPNGKHNSVPMIPFFCIGTIVTMLIWG